MSYRVLNSMFSLHLMVENVGGIIKQWNVNFHRHKLVSADVPEAARGREI